MNSKCPITHDGRVCILENYHDNYCIDETGFKFIDEDYPDHLGNNAAGYPMNNKAFDAAVARVVARNKTAAEQAQKFMDMMSKELQRLNDKRRK